MLSFILLFYPSFLLSPSRMKVVHFASLDVIEPFPLLGHLVIPCEKQKTFARLAKAFRKIENGSSKKIFQKDKDKNRTKSFRITRYTKKSINFFARVKFQLTDAAVNLSSSLLYCYHISFFFICFGETGRPVKHNIKIFYNQTLCLTIDVHCTMKEKNFTTQTCPINNFSWTISMEIFLKIFKEVLTFNSFGNNAHTVVWRCLILFLTVASASNNLHGGDLLLTKTNHPMHTLDIWEDFLLLVEEIFTLLWRRCACKNRKISNKNVFLRLTLSLLFFVVEIMYATKCKRR